MINAIVVRNINWIGVAEANLLLSDGEHECRVFCHPCGYKIGDVVTNLFHVLGTRSVRISTESSPRIEYQEGPSNFEHWVVGRVNKLVERTISKEGSVTVGSFEIQGIELPGDIQKGDIVEFAASRLDVI